MDSVTTTPTEELATQGVLTVLGAGTGAVIAKIALLVLAPIIVGVLIKVLRQLLKDYQVRAAKDATDKKELEDARKTAESNAQANQQARRDELDSRDAKHEARKNL